MRKLLIASVFALAGVSAGFASAQTEVEAVETTQTVVEAAKTVQTEQTLEDVAKTRQASWYGKPYALSGNDVVSFKSAGGPVAGSEEFKAEWDNTEWRFSSERPGAIYSRVRRLLPCCARKRRF